MRVLVVDDERSIRSVVQRFLHRAGYQTDVAEDAQSALDALDAGDFGVVVSDIVLPGMSGVALLKAIRERAPDLQVVMMTGAPTIDTAAAAIRAGACDYLTKPIGRESLVYSVGRAARIRYLIEEKKRLDAENREHREHLEELVERRSAALARSERRLRAILEHIQTGIFVVDVETRAIVEANPVACEMLGTCEDEIIGRDCDTFILDTPTRESLVNAGNQALPNEESLIITGAGERRPVLKTVVATELEGRLCMVESFVDISAQKETERKLREATELAESASRAKSELLANVSHELRTPLNGILGMAELALGEPLDDEVRDYIETIRTSGEVLLHTLSNLAELAAAGMASPDEVSREEIHPGEVIAQAAERIRGGAEKKGLALEIADAGGVPSVSGDRQRIERILDCLLDNAVKFTDCGRIGIGAELVSEGVAGPTLRISVSDTGCGIPENKLETVFEPFAMADASSVREHEGLGLGLALATRLASLLGGSLEVVSTPGTGSRFTLEIPVDS